MSTFHGMKIGVVAETAQRERRVALVPEAAGKLIASGFVVEMEAGAGERACFTDDAYRKPGVQIESNRQALLSAAEVVLSVQPLPVKDAALLQPDTITISFLQPASQGTIVETLARQHVTAYSLDLLPRSSRAQSMDALSSQSSLAGYKAVLMAANRLGKFFPMLITAAGTVPPARVLVLGAGVAGLQAIATARRLGAIVEAYDVRQAVEEEVESLGATFLKLELTPTINRGATGDKGGYAREQSEEFLVRQRELLTEHIAAADVVITTAAVPGRQAPLLITTTMVKKMRRGSVIVDLAAETGGNCEATRPNQIIEIDGVWVDGTTNIPSSMALHASQLYSRNVTNLLLYLVRQGKQSITDDLRAPTINRGATGDEGSVSRLDSKLTLDFEDEITRSCCVTHAGQIVSPRVRQMLGMVVAQEND